MEEMVLIIGDRGKMMCDTYGENPRLLPSALNEHVQVPKLSPVFQKGTIINGLMLV